MPYIGNDLATQFQAFATQTITGDGSTSYTLDRAVANGKELLVYINNVKQEEGSGKSYEASGTTITFSEAVASGDSCYLVYMGSAQQTVTAPAGSIVSSQFSSADLTLTGDVGIGVAPTTSYGRVAQIHDTGTSGANLRLTDSTSSAGTGNGFEIIQLGVNSYLINREAGFMSIYTSGTEAMNIDANGHIIKPKQSAFYAEVTAAQTLSANTLTTVAHNTERFDQNADYNTSTYKFVAPVTGKYLLTLYIRLDRMDQASDYVDIRIRTSNRNYQQVFDTDVQTSADLNFHSFGFSVVADMDANDEAYTSVYVEGSVSSSHGSTYVNTTGSTGFSGCLLA